MYRAPRCHPRAERTRRRAHGSSSAGRRRCASGSSSARPRPRRAPTTRRRRTRRFSKPASTGCSSRSGTAATSSTCRRFWRVDHRDRARLPFDRVVPLPRVGPRAAGRLALRGAGAGRDLRRRATSSAPPSPRPRASRRRTADGWELNSTHPYSSGAPYSTHYMGQTFVTGRPGRAAAILLFVAPAQRVDDARRLGRRRSVSRARARTASASRTRASRRTSRSRTPGWSTPTSRDGTPGYRLHGNPMYAGRTLGVLPERARRGHGRRSEGRARRVRGDPRDAQDPTAADRPADRGPGLPALVRPRDRPGRDGGGRSAPLRRSSGWSWRGGAPRRVSRSRARRISAST